MSTEKPQWMSIPCDRLFVEDDARPYDMERVGPAYLRLRGATFRVEDAIDTYDAGDICYYLMADRRTIVCVSWPGNGMILVLDAEATL